METERNGGTLWGAFQERVAIAADARRLPEVATYRPKVRRFPTLLVVCHHQVSSWSC